MNALMISCSHAFYFKVTSCFTLGIGVRFSGSNEGYLQVRREIEKPTQEYHAFYLRAPALSRARPADAAALLRSFCKEPGLMPALSRARPAGAAALLRMRSFCKELGLMSKVAFDAPVLDKVVGDDIITSLKDIVA